jgi:hypothetical protein
MKRSRQCSQAKIKRWVFSDNLLALSHNGLDQFQFWCLWIRFGQAF